MSVEASFLQEVHGPGRESDVQSRSSILVDVLRFLDHPGPLAIAHRGGASGAVENSLAAFERATALGYRYLETDVHATVDGVLVAFHDDCLDRLTDRTGLIGELPWREVRAARVGGTEAIPRLTDLLEAFPDARFTIDVKADAAVDPLIEAIRVSHAEDRISVGAFSQPRLRRIRRGLPGVCTAMGPREARLLLFAAGRYLPPRAVPRAARCVQVPEWHEGTRVVDAALVRLAHRLRLQVHVWTVNEPADMHRLLDLGVDGLVTDRTRLLRDVLTERGAWRPRPHTAE